MTNVICGWSGYGFSGTVTTFTAGAGCLNTPFPLRGILNNHPAGSPVITDVYSQAGCTGNLLVHLSPGQGRAFLVPSGLSLRAQWL